MCGTKCRRRNGRPRISARRALDLQGGTDVYVRKFVEFITISIDIKPDEFPNTINLRSKGTVPLRMYGHVHPILPGLGATSLFAFYIPETLRSSRY